MSGSYLDFKAIREPVPFLGVFDRYHVEVKRVNEKEAQRQMPPAIGKFPMAVALNPPRNRQSQLCKPGITSSPCNISSTRYP